ncbi:ATP-dependent Clp protease adaptor ClpS [Candidatus Thiothrix sp. Deng01]|uniref:ATP-dependent Clp protease adaptor ClpS n=1 Tax=Candidatus Thiothrix phosphatis TaxID=3112415 RepID=A0ABU6D2M8_9GAMM|nr:ATP-dependent Clp protease adaptor ClpS [Candidatus Thiothrix sp. Deng01]MEB4593325.1 ATP-dependent Clp protease adaptor ClpS [Candidatus Thiothrix sp. Deng01]
MSKEKLVNLILSVILVLIEIPLILLSGWLIVSLVTKEPFDPHGLLSLSFPLTFTLVFGVLAWKGLASINVVGAALTVRSWRILAAICILIGVLAGSVQWVGILLPFLIAAVCIQADPLVRRFFTSVGSKYVNGLHTFSIANIPIYVHGSLIWTCLLISVVVQFDLELMLFSCIGYILVVGVHEAGHVIAARMQGLNVIGVYFSDRGGLCRMEKAPRQFGEALFVYSAGILAQLALLGVTLVYLLVFGEPTSVWETCLVFWFTVINVFLIVVNLIPFQGKWDWPPHDGFVLWRLLVFKYRGLPYSFQDLSLIPVEEAPVFAPSTALLSMPGMAPEGFERGVEILNDKTTPMTLVIALLKKHFCLEETEAIQWMTDIHNDGYPY